MQRVTGLMKNKIATRADYDHAEAAVLAWKARLEQQQADLNVAGVEKVFRRGSEDIHVLKDLHLKMPAGEFWALMGPSGSGRSKLPNLIGRLDRPTRGTLSMPRERSISTKASLATSR